MGGSVVFAPPHGNFGPGLPMQWTTSPPGGGASKLVIEAYITGDGVPFYRETFTGSFTASATVTPMIGQGVIDTTTTPKWAYSDDSVTMAIFTETGTGTVVDFVSTTATWEGREGIGRQIALKPTGGGLTTGQAAQLTQVETNTNAQQTQWNDYVTVTLPSLQDVLNTVSLAVQTTVVNPITGLAQTIGELFSGKTLDQLTEGDLGSACWPDVLNATAAMGGSAFGLQVQATSVPDYYARAGADDSYYEEVLFVLEIRRGGNTLVRRGVHTLTHMEYPMPGVPEFSVVLPVPVDPGDYSIKITPNVNVCVAAQLLGFP